MLVLALDTTTRAGSVALVERGRIIAEQTGNPARTHAERLPGEILQLLGHAGVQLPAVEVFAVAAGPGSFTGLRIGIATIQGLALVQQRRVVPVSALEALAHAGSAGLTPGATVAAWMDAHRHEVFSARYKVADAAAFTSARLIELDPPAVGRPEATLERWRRSAASDVFIGDGAALYREAIGNGARILPAPPLAGTIGLLAAERAIAGHTVDPAGIQPLYVRRPDAEIDRDTRAIRAQTATTTKEQGSGAWSIEPLTTPDDIDVVLAIEHACFTNPWTRDMYLAELENQGVSYFYLARKPDGQIIAFCAFWRILDELHINNLAVLHGYRRQGVASALLTRVLEEGQRLGATRATLEVRESNVDARRLYEGFGFAVAGIRRGYYTGPVEDALILWREQAENR
jgi:tRNA threonylcarbamoyl adenosine modification protein YeaZ/ribosomal-protein-alanine acetyltransferase